MVNEHIISMPDKWEYPWFAEFQLVGEPKGRSSNLGSVIWHQGW
jgi:hypothetical protein